MNPQPLHRRLHRRLPADGDSRRLVRRAFPPPPDIKGTGISSSTDVVSTSDAPTTTPAGAPVASEPATTSESPTTTNKSNTPNPFKPSSATGTSSVSTGTQQSSSSSTTSVTQTTSATVTLPKAVPTAPAIQPFPSVGYTSPVPPTLTSGAAAATSSAPASNNAPTSNVGGIVGGIFAGLLGLAILSVVVRYLTRRRRDSYEVAAFNPTEFRRSAVLLDDPPTHAETVARGYNPRPPSMIERRLAPGPGLMSGAANQSGATSAGGYNGVQPGYPPQPKYMNAAYVSPIVQPPPSPAMASPYNNGYDASSQAPGNPYLTRQPAGPAVYGQEQYATANYVPVDRSSPPNTASPFESPALFAVSRSDEQLFPSPTHPQSPPPVTPESNDHNRLPSEEYTAHSGLAFPPPPTLVNHPVRPSEDSYGVVGAHPRQPGGNAEPRPVSSLYNEGEAYDGI